MHPPVSRFERSSAPPLTARGEDLFRIFIESVRDYALLILDPNGRITTWNQGAEAIKGWSADEIVGQHFGVFYPPEAIAAGLPERELIVAARDGRYEDEGWRMRKGGTRFWANVVITALRDADGALIGFAKVTRDLTERRKHETRLRQSEERVRMLVESVVDYAIVTLDGESRINSWNLGAERITCFSAAEILGSPHSRLYTPEDVEADKPWQQLRRATDGSRVNEEGWRLRKDGSQYWANSVLGRLPGGEGTPPMYYLVIQDLTQRRHAESLADTAQRMHEFIAMLAHELRNPLAPIRNAVALMHRREIGDPIVESMRQTIERQASQLTRIIDELLDVNRVARGQFTIERQSIDLRDILQRAVETSRPLIDSRQHALSLSIPAEPILVEADPLRMQQVVVNLLNNAAKYTPPGGQISLVASLDDDHVTFRVRDTGQGIDRDSLDRVFDLFFQLDPTTSSSFGGLGVGLALVRRIVELHGGRVFARSEGAGRGAEFVVRIPRSSASEATQPQEAYTEVGATKALRVLVVDDNVDAADTLALVIEQMGAEVRTAYDGAAALRVCESYRPQLVLLDIGMPHMNGYDVARGIRMLKGPGNPLIAAITGWGQESDKARAREAGFDQHFTKPISEAALQELIHDAVGRLTSAA